ncbi:MAG: sugar phosphate nucleotidyltransferase, partial [Candidatus Woesearchaeota archaeon]
GDPALRIGKRSLASVIDAVVLNTYHPPAAVVKHYEQAGCSILLPSAADKQALAEAGIEVYEGNILLEEAKQEWNKALYLRHDSKKTAAVLYTLIQPQKPLVGVILAAGSGTRMRPFSLSTSKVMLSFLGKPLLAHHVDEFLTNGITQLVIICNPTNLQQIAAYFAEHYPSVDIKYAVQEEQRGPAHALLAAKKYLLHTRFILKYGDSIAYEDQIKGLLEVMRKVGEEKGIVTLRDVDTPSEYGIARFSEGKIVEIVEKPKVNPPSHLANVGLAMLDADLFFAAVEKYGYAKVLPPPQYLLMEGHSLSYWISRSARVDVGRAYDLLAAQKLLMEKLGIRGAPMYCSPSAVVDKTVYLAPTAVIEDDVQIRGYSSVAGFIGKGTTIENSIIMEGSRIGPYSFIRNSVIGKHNLIESHFTTLVGQGPIYVHGRYVDPKVPLGVFTGDHVTIFPNLRASPGKMVFPNKVITEDITQDKLVRAVLFDADNTLYATKAIARQADLAACQRFASLLADAGIKSLPSTLQTSTNRTADHNSMAEQLYALFLGIVKQVQHDPNPAKRHRTYSYTLLLEQVGYPDPKEGAKEGFAAFKAAVLTALQPMPHLVQALHELKATYALAVCSEDSKELLDAKLAALGLRGFFDAVISADDVGVMKPSASYYERVFAVFGVAANECLVVGDHVEKDLLIPKQLGATTVLFSQEQYPSLPQGVDYLISDFSALVALLKEL